MPANANHEKSAQCRKKYGLPDFAFGNPDFFGNVRNVSYPRAENETETGI
jgi:hypothetical protein